MPDINMPATHPDDVWGVAVNTAVESVNAAVDASETRIEALEAGGGGAALVPAPDNPGFYIIPSGSSVTPDPDNPGFYKIGA